MEHEHHQRRIVRPEESKWTEYFIDTPSLSCSCQLEESMKEKREKLVKKVGCMIEGYTSSKNNLPEGMKMVDAIERLGVGYHFQEEISRFMAVLNATPAPATENVDMAMAALRFRLLRQHQHNASCDIFESFVDSNGDFKETLRRDVDALLNLYEAAHLGYCEEDLLKSAVVFTTGCLTAMAGTGQLPRHTVEKVDHALTSPTMRRMKRLEAKLYISIYENDEDSNHDILELAKLDFHILQQMHRDEARSFSLWYKELNAGSTLGPYIRVRPVECYFWALCVFYEPRYANARMMFAKLIKIFSFFDDTFDSYGTLEELHLFNQAVQRWDEDGAKQIGGCFGYVMSLLSKTLDEFVAEGASPLGIDCTKKSIKEVSRCMLQEVIWREEGQAPLLHDHLKFSTVSTFYWALACISFVDPMDANDDVGVFGWTMSSPKIIENSATMARLMDDISGHETEKDRSGIPDTVECYMKEHGVRVQVAKKALWCLVEEQWRSMNHEFVSNTVIPVALLQRVINLARLMETTYKTGHGYTVCSGITEPISNVLDTCVFH
ncbi:(-)-germacrene D synthase-like isoform X2 [Oryza brachyantha]|uniref:(-)-germacrene D synthase-like isoform X2 n=1 Tax=Oryza brachyantha TaxID=4533 RepID=UPI001ADCDFF2|nr:(-)-germacrene D synthase-like isoform X2 [Oryza brachyantha]